MRLMISAILVSPFLALSASADELEPVSTQAIYACSEIADDMARLACYDESVGRLEAAEEAGEVTTISKAEVKEIQKDSFGFSLPSLALGVLPRFGGGEDEESARLVEVEFPIASVRELSLDRVRVTLENGQVWEQKESDYRVYSAKRGAEIAFIERGAMGGYRMKIDGGRAFRVKRIQ